MTDKEISCLRLSENNFDSGEEGAEIEFTETVPSQRVR